MTCLICGAPRDPDATACPYCRAAYEPETREAAAKLAGILTTNEHRGLFRSRSRLDRHTTARRDAMGRELGRGVGDESAGGPICQ